MIVVLLAIVVVAAAMLAMAVGMLLSGRCLRGSCGGLETLGDSAGESPCDDCPLRSDTRVSEPLPSILRARADGPTA